MEEYTNQRWPAKLSQLWSNHFPHNKVDTQVWSDMLTKYSPTIIILCIHKTTKKQQYSNMNTGQMLTYIQEWADTISRPTIEPERVRVWRA